MQTPAMPPDEMTRLAALRALHILDTPAEERFDRLTRLAKRLFGVPIALVSLVDGERQWFKSCVGLDASETSRDVSFCGHAILGNEIFVVENAALDPRFSDNPLVIDAPYVRFYAGCPLTVPNGSKLGTLCLIDREPREFGPDDMALLQDLARMAEQELAALQLATMDELTLLSNRRGFAALSVHALAVCRRLDRTASLLFFDLDLFKQINDRFGHAEGDYALKRFAQLLKDTFRESDVIGRLGGDEFAVLVSDAGVLDVPAALDRMKNRVDEHNRSSQRGYELRYSFGVVSFNSGRHSGLPDLMAEADKLMYEEKRRRNQR